jgi:hypothetical protein
MDAQNIEKLNQLISRRDMTGNEKVEWLISFINNYQALQLLQPDVMRCSSKEIDKFFKDTMYTDLTNYYGIIQKTQKGNYVKWRSPSQMIKDFFKWKRNNA